MSVHDTMVYPRIKQLLGIPEDEPIFILRAQDNTSLPTLATYAANADYLGTSKEFVRDIADLSMAFASWRVDNKDKCKTPD